MYSLSSVESSLLKEFAKILISIGEEERLVEISRQLLSQDLSFSPLKIFSQISPNNVITLEEFQNFITNTLSINYVGITEHIKSLFNYLDYEHKGALSYKDFTNIVYPKNNPSLKMIIINRGNSSSHSPISNNTKILMNRLIRREIDLFTKFAIKMHKLVENTAIFDIRTLYQTILLFNNNQFPPTTITKEHIYNLLSYAKIKSFSEDTIEAIMRRFDINGIGTISYETFSHFINSVATTKIQRLNIERKQKKNGTYVTGLKIREAYGTSSKIVVNPLETTMSMFEKQFIKYLSLLMQIEGEIEKRKTNLITNSDFNIDSAFFMFKSTSINTITEAHQKITKEDMERFLREQHVQFSANDVSLLMKRCDLTHKGFIDPGDFFDMLVPFEKDYRDVIERRDKSIVTQMTQGTFVQMVNFIKSLIEYERVINNSVVSFNANKDFISIIFRKIAKENPEYFTYDNLYSFYVSNNVIANKKEFKLMFIRLDKARKGKIELFSLLDEMTYII